MLQLIPSTRFLKQAPRPWVMILVGALLLAMAIGRSLDGLPRASLDDRAAVPERPVQSERGFLPMTSAVQPPALAPEKAFSNGLRSDRFMDLESATSEGSQAIMLPDGRSVNAGYVPTRLIIPKIELDTPVVTASLATTQFDGDIAYQWLAPDFYGAGWHYNSAALGEIGNTVINGHHNAYGEVFRYLKDLEVGDWIIVGTAGSEYRFEVSEILRLQEKFVAPEVRQENANWIGPTADERLTLVTCWPYESNSYRLLVIARPVKTQISGGVQETN